MDSIPLPPDPLAAFDGGHALTIADVGPVALELFFMPGNWLIWATASHTPALARFLDVGAHGYGGVLSACLSALAWISLLVTASIAYRAVRDFDEALTRRIAQGWTDMHRRARIATTLAAYRVRKLAAPKRAASTVELAEELDLTDLEVRLLRAHAELAPGYVLSVTEAAAAVGCRKQDAQRAIDRLRRHDLLRRTLGGGENASTLTAAGRGFLLFRQMTPNAPAAGLRDS